MVKKEILIPQTRFLEKVSYQDAAVVQGALAMRSSMIYPTTALDR
jgi:hypothetical protein